MPTTQIRPSRVKWVKDVKGQARRAQAETRQLMKNIHQENKEKASALKQFLNESEKDRLTIQRETMNTIKSQLRQLSQEEKAIIRNAHDLIRRISEENRELASGVKQFLSHSKTERQTTYKTMMGNLHQEITELKARVKEIQRESKDLLRQLIGEHGALTIEMKNFLKESEETRKKDFNKTMAEVKAVVNEIRAYEREEKRLAGASIKEVPVQAAPEESKKKEIPPKAEPEKKTTGGKVKVEAERRKLMSYCKRCGTRHWPFQKCPKETSSFEKKEIS